MENTELYELPELPKEVIDRLRVICISRILLNHNARIVFLRRINEP